MADSEWEFEPEDVGEEEADLEPETPSLESAVFFLLGVAAALLALWTLLP